jgi:hypothetical protein
MLNLERSIDNKIESNIWTPIESVVRNTVRYETHVWIYNLTDSLGLSIYRILLNFTFKGVPVVNR